MSCSCDCFVQEVKKQEGKIYSKIVIKEPVKTITPSVLSKPTPLPDFDYENFMTKKIFHGMPTIRESQEEEDDDVVSRRHSKIGAVTKKKKLTFKEPESTQYYELKEKLLCFFCGGESCKHENWKLHPNTPIKGLNCDLIYENIYASQRLSNRLINEYQLIKSFKEKEIGLIINLQREGEHPFCGDKLILETGFSYDPQLLISEGIKYRNFGWEDMNVPQSMGFVIEIMKEMFVTIKEENKKVLVHCHAGYGRTGIVIACYMIMDSSKCAEEIVDTIRKIRPQSIQKTSQMDFCIKFRNFIDSLRIIFKSGFQPLEHFIKNQNLLLFGEEAKRLRHVPKLLVELIERIIEIKENQVIPLRQIYQDLYLLEFWDEDLENKICNCKKELNRWNWNELNELKEVNDIPILIQLLYDWIEDNLTFLVPASKIKSVYDHLSEEELLKYIINYTLASKQVKDNIIHVLKNNFKLTEFECLLYISRLLASLYPTFDSEEEFMFDRVLEKLLLSITGINPRKIGYKFCESISDPGKLDIPNEMIMLFQKFNSLMRFLALYVKYEMNGMIFNENMTHNFRGNFNKSPTILTINTFANHLDKLKSGFNTKKRESKNSSVSFINIEKSEFLKKTEEKDNKMYQIYTVLNKMFNGSNNLDEDFDKDFSKDMSFQNLIKENNDEKENIFEIFEKFKLFLNLQESKEPILANKGKIKFSRSRTTRDFDKVKSELQRKNSLLNKTQKMSVIVEEDIADKYQSKATNRKESLKDSDYEKVLDVDEDDKLKLKPIDVNNSNRKDVIHPVSRPLKKVKLPSLYSTEKITDKVNSIKLIQPMFGYAFINQTRGKSLGKSFFKK